MQIIRIVADTQLVYDVPITIYGARLVSTAAVPTTADIYDAVGGSVDTTKRIALATIATVLCDDVKIPAEGVKFSTGCYVSWTAGELFLTVD